jgi:hypothetical protein
MRAVVYAYGSDVNGEWGLGPAFLALGLKPGRKEYVT